jgi:hypothetical protein
MLIISAEMAKHDASVTTLIGVHEALGNATILATGNEEQK